MNKLITIVGPSGTGKTSFAQALSRTGNFTMALEQHAERPFQMLAKQDPRHTFANQMDYLLLRAEQERMLRLSPKIGLVDGGLDLDFHGFTRLFLERNLLTRHEFDLCRRFYHLLRELLPSPDLIIRLRAEKRVVTERLSRRNRINIANPDDTPLFNSYLDEWLASVPPERVMGLDVTNETLEYNQSVAAVLSRISGLDQGEHQCTPQTCTRV